MSASKLAAYPNLILQTYLCLKKRFSFALVGLHFLSVLVASTALAQIAPEPDLIPPLRDLPKDRAYELRVLYLEDRRLPSLKSEQRQELYSKIERLLDAWYGYRVKLREVKRQPLTDYFSAHDPLFRQQAALLRDSEVDVANSAGLEKLHATIVEDFRGRSLSQIARYLRQDTLPSKSAAVEFAQQQFLRAMTELREIPLADGAPFFDPKQARQNSFPYWATLIETLTEADLVFTNSMIVSADAEMPIYVIARGGLTTGLTDNNVRSPYQAAMMVGLFPFLSDAPVFLRERGRIPESERLDVIATFCMHELGHFFLRYAEHYDHAHCVHVAPTGLNYYQWHKAIRTDGPCLLAHDKLQRF